MRPALPEVPRALTRGCGAAVSRLWRGAGVCRRQRGRADVRNGCGEYSAAPRDAGAAGGGGVGRKRVTGPTAGAWAAPFIAVRVCSRCRRFVVIICGAKLLFQHPCDKGYVIMHAFIRAVFSRRAMWYVSSWGGVFICCNWEQRPSSRQSVSFRQPTHSEASSQNPASGEIPLGSSEQPAAMADRKPL